MNYFVQKGKKKTKKNSIIGHEVSHEKIHLTKCSEMITPKKTQYN